MQIVFAEILVPQDFTIRLLLGSVVPQGRVTRLIMCVKKYSNILPKISFSVFKGIQFNSLSTPKIFTAFKKKFFVLLNIHKNAFYALLLSNNIIFHCKEFLNPS